MRPNQAAGAANGLFLAVAIPFSLLLSAASAGLGGSPAEVSMQIVALLLFGVSVLTTGGRFIEAPVYKESRTSALLVVLFLCSATVSGVFAEDQLLSVSYVVGIAVTFLISGAVWNLPIDKVLTSLRNYAVITAVLALGVWLITPAVGRRFGGVVHSNYWGLLCLSVFCLAVLIRSVLFRSAIQMVSIVIILAAQSRSALLAVLVASFVFVYSRFQSARLGIEAKLAVLVATSIGVFLTVAIAHEKIYDVFARAFMINDRYRGVTSGFSGRTALWRAGLDVFAAHPWFGVGAKMESNFISVAGMAHAHNGYINMLVQFGTIGAGLFFVLSALALRRLLHLAHQGLPGGSAGIAFVCGYAVLAVFEPKLINIGNPVSIIMTVFLLRPTGRTVSTTPIHNALRRQAWPPATARRPIMLRTSIR